MSPSPLVLDLVHLDFPLLVQSSARLGLSSLALGPVWLESVFFLPVIDHLHPGLSLLARSLAHLRLFMSVLDLMHLELSLLVQSMVRLGLSALAWGLSRLDLVFLLSAIDHQHLDLFSSARSSA